MTIARVQGNALHAGAATSNSVSLTGVTSGNLLVIGIVTGSAGTVVNSVTDGASNTWTRRSGRKFQTGAGGTEIWEAHNVTGGNLTITAAYSASVGSDLHVNEYSSADTSAPFDVQNSAGASSTAPNSGNATTAVDHELVVGACSYGLASGSFTAGTGFTDRSSTSFPLDYEDNVDIGVAGSYAATGTLSSAANWAMCMATFKPAAGGGAGPTYPQLEHARMRGANRGMLLGVR